MYTQRQRQQHEAIRSKDQEIESLLKKSTDRAISLPIATENTLEPKVKLPEPFNSDRHYLRGFLNQLRLIWKIQPRRYANDAVLGGLTWNFTDWSSIKMVLANARKERLAS